MMLIHPFFFFIVFGLMGSPTKFRAGVVAKIFDLTAGKLVAPEQLLISPCSLAPESNMNVMRIKEMTANCGSSSL